jgi:DNA-binding protein YbaB
MMLFVAILSLCFVGVLSFSFPRMPVASSSTKKFLFGNPEPPKNTPAKKPDGGMFGGMGNLMESMKKAQEIAKQAEVVNKELMDTAVVGNDPSGQAFATFNGLGMPIGLKVSDALVAQGAEAVSLAASQAMVDGHAKSQNAMMTKMQALYSGAGVPVPKQ